MQHLLKLQYIETVVWLSSSGYILLVHSCIWSWRSSGVMQHFVRQYRLLREKITCGSPTPSRQERGGESNQSSLRVLRGKGWHGYDNSSKQENWSLVETIDSFSKDLSDILSRWIFFNLLQESVLVGEQTPPLESSRPQGVQFPFAVSGRVLIKVSASCGATFENLPPLCVLYNSTKVEHIDE